MPYETDLVYLDIETLPMQDEEISDYVLKRHRAQWERKKSPPKTEDGKIDEDMLKCVEPTLGSICAVGIMDDIEHTTEPYILGERREHTEYTILYDFQIYMRDYVSSKATIVTFNGHSFDLPYLRLRMAKYNLIDTWIWSKLDPSRYSSRNRDLREILTGYNQYALGDLRYWCEFFGVWTEDPSGIDGKDVPETWKKGKYDKVIQHCKHDILMLQKLDMKLRGKLK